MSRAITTALVAHPASVPVAASGLRVNEVVELETRAGGTTTLHDGRLRGNDST